MVDLEDYLYMGMALGLVTLGIAGVFALVNIQTKTEKYIIEHECQIVRTETKTRLQPMMTGKVMTTMPMTRTHRAYRCKIDGERGRSSLVLNHFLNCPPLLHRSGFLLYNNLIHKDIQ